MSARRWPGAVLALAGCGWPSTPGSPDLHVNEVVASNHHSCTDDTGGSADWVELYNASDEPLDAFGYALTDDTDPITDEVRLGRVKVPAGGVKVLWADGRPDLGPSHLAFKLSAQTEKLLLYGPDGVLLDRLDWDEAATDVSRARFPDGVGPTVSCAVPTCGAVNGAACSSP